MASPPMHRMITIVFFAGALSLVGFLGIVFMPPGMSGIPWSVGVFALFVIIALIMGIVLPLQSSFLAAALFWLSSVSVDLYATTLGHRFEFDHRLVLLVFLLAILHGSLRKDHRGGAAMAAWGTRALNPKRPAAELIDQFERFGYVTVYHSDELDAVMAYVGAHNIPTWTHVDSEMFAVTVQTRPWGSIEGVG